MKTTSLALVACLAALTAATQYASEAYAVRHHRRHHARRGGDLYAPLPKRAFKKCSASKPKKHSSANSSSHSSSGHSTKSPSNKKPSSGKSGKSKGKGCPNGTLSVKGVCIGMLPDGGSDGGPRNTMKQLNSLITRTNSKHAVYGQYGQTSGGQFDGGQLLQVLDDVKESGAIFQPAVMPTHGWTGLTPDNDYLARDICNVMKKFTDEGIEVWLRFAHEVNWYQTDGTFQGNSDDFKTGWNTVGKACKEIAPDVKMFFTPNWASLDVYKEFYPGNDYMDYIGIDAYPKDASNLDGVFLSVAKEFHDEFCKEDGPHFAMGETGLAMGGNAEQKMQWLKSMVDAKAEMPYFHSIAWFNYIKSENGMNNIPFKIVDPDDQATTDAFLSYVTNP